MSPTLYIFKTPCHPRRLEACLTASEVVDRAGGDVLTYSQSDLSYCSEVMDISTFLTKILRRLPINNKKCHDCNNRGDFYY